MQQTVFLFVGTLAVLATIGRFRPYDNITRTVLSFAGMVLWIFWALQAYNVEVCDGAGCAVSHSYGGLAALGLTFGSAMLVLGFYSAIQTVGDADAEAPNPGPATTRGDTR